MALEKKKYQNIQLLRIMACVGTFLVHLGQRIELEGVLRRITDLGAFGVYLFFFISGFVSFLSIDNSQKTFSTSKYLLGRLVRIVPVYYLVIIYNFVLHTFILKDVPADSIMGMPGPMWFRYLFFLNIVLPCENNFWDNLCATWTIKIFVLFYLLVPLLRKFITSSGRAFIAWIVFYLVGMLKIPFINMQAVSHLHYLFLGILVYFVVKEKRLHMLMLTFVVYTLINGMLMKDWRMVIMMILFSCLIIGSMGLQVKHPMAVKIMDKLDEYSYTIYLVHAVFIDWADRYKAYVGGENWRMGTMMIIVVGTIIGCIAVHELFEKPIQRKCKK